MTLQQIVHVLKVNAFSYQICDERQLCGQRAVAATATARLAHFVILILRRNCRLPIIHRVAL